MQAETLNLAQYACPHCLANDRSRLYAPFIRSQVHGVKSAEKPLAKMIREFACLEYRSADLQMAGVDDLIDITDMSVYGTNSFDCLLCSHVLEHVPDDRKAMNEVFRILRSGGWGIVMAPISLRLSSTIEDVDLADPAERARRFGQADHLRIYARQDFIQKLHDAGFVVEQLGITHFGADVFRKNGIRQDSVLYVCRKD